MYCVNVLPVHACKPPADIAIRMNAIRWSNVQIKKEKKFNLKITCSYNKETYEIAQHETHSAKKRTTPC